MLHGFVRAAPICAIIRVNPNTRVNPNSIMHSIYSIWLLVRSAARALGRGSDRMDQIDAELYLAGSNSIAELELRERDWLLSH